MGEFKVGDRVRVPVSIADSYIQPWRDRIRRKSGLCGTVIRDGCGFFDIQWDAPKRAKWPHEWVWRIVAPHEIEPIE